MREQSEPWCRGPGVKGRAAAFRRPGARLKRPKHHDDTHWHSTENESSHRMTHSVLTHSTHSTTQRRLTHTHTHSKTCDIQVLSLLSNTPTLSISHKLWLAQNYTVCRSAPTAPCLHCAAAGKRTGGTILAGWSEGLWERKRRQGGREGERDDHRLCGWMNCSSGDRQSCATRHSVSSPPNTTIPRSAENVIISH